LRSKGQRSRSLGTKM